MKILNFGSLNLDYVYSVDQFVRPGETKSSKKREVFAGGKGLNQSIALARSGAHVYHAGAVGKLDGNNLEDLYSISPMDSSGKIEAVKIIFEESGAAELTRTEIAKYTNQAFEILDQINLPEKKKSLLKQFGTSLMDRVV